MKNLCSHFFLLNKVLKMYLCICDHIPQTSVDSVEVLLKKHEDFESTSVAHDDRIRTLSEQANKLIHAGHYDAERLTASGVHVNSAKEYFGVTCVCVCVCVLDVMSANSVIA